MTVPEISYCIGLSRWTLWRSIAGAWWGGNGRLLGRFTRRPPHIRLHPFYGRFMLNKNNLRLKMRRVILGVVAFAMSAGASAAWATSAVDVDNLLAPASVTQGSGGFSAESSFTQVGHREVQAAQTWTVGVSGQLTEIDLFGSAFSTRSADGVTDFSYPPINVTLSILGGGSLNLPGDQLLGSITKSSSEIPYDEVSSFDLSSLNINAKAGDILTFRMSVEPCQPIGYCFDSWVNTNTINGVGNTYNYDGGSAFVYTNVYGPPEILGFPSQDLNFRTWMAAAVPEPSSWALMIAGFGLSGFALRRRWAQPSLSA